MKPTKTNKKETLMKKILDRIFGFELLLAECKTKDDYEEQKMIFDRGLGYRSWPLIAVVSIGFGLLFTYPNSLEDINIGKLALYSSLIMGFTVVCFELARRRAVAICEQRINELSMQHVGRKGQIQDMGVFENDKSHYNEVVVAPAGAGMSFYLSQNPENIDTTKETNASHP